MPGIQDFTRFDVGKETVRGTPVAPTRKLYGEGTGVLAPDFGLNFHEGENTGRRLRVRRATSQREDVTLKFRTVSGTSFDELVVPFSQLRGAVTGTGAGADKAWSFVPSLTAANSPESYSIDVGDDVQNWRVQYAMAKRIKLAAALGDVTSLEMDWFGQRAVKTAAAAPAGNLSLKIPGELWSPRFATSFAGLPGAAVQSNFLVGWEMEILTGLVWAHYMDGNPYGSQHVETDISGKFTLTVESTALAISEFYDKALSATMDWLRLRAVGSALGGSTYLANVDAALLWEVPEPITDSRDGINLYKVVGRLADDGTNSIACSLTNSIAALP
jgi:hypothetical protein